MHWLSLAGLTFAALFPLVNPIAGLPLFASLTQGGTPKWRKQMAIKASLFVFLILFVTELVGNGLLSFFGLSLGMLQIAGGLIVAHTAWEMSTGAPKISDSEKHKIKRKVFVAMREATVHAVTSAAETVARAGHQVGHSVDLMTQRSDDAGQPDVADHPNDANHPGGSDDSGRSRISNNSDDGQVGGSEADHQPPQSSASTGASKPQPDGGSTVRPNPTGAVSTKLPDISFSPMAMPMLAGPGSMGVVIGLVSQNHGALDGLGIGVGIAMIAALSLVVLLAASPINSWLGAGGVMVLQRVFGFITLGIAVALVAEGISSLFGIPLVN